MHTTWEGSSRPLMMESSSFGISVLRKSYRSTITLKNLEISVAFHRTGTIIDLEEEIDLLKMIKSQLQ